MREEDSNWFSKWEEELPQPEELTPLSQTLITRDLALAFDIQTPNSHGNFNPHQQFHQFHHRSSQIPETPPPPVPAHLQSSGDFDSSSAEFGGGGSGGGGGGVDEPARTLKRPRLVWTPQLHKRFVDAVAHLGIKNAVPKTIMQLMSVDGLTRENVASHLQKYRLYLKRMQGINGGGGGASAGSGGGSGDPATDHLFASSPVPAHLLGGGGGGGRANSEHFMGYVSPAALHHQQVAAMVAGGQYHHHLHNRQMGHFGSPTSGVVGGGQFDHPFLARQAQVAVGGGRLGGGGGGSVVVQNSGHGYVEDVELGTPANGRKVLTLFPANED